MSKPALALDPKFGSQPDDEPAYELIELFFFAYRDFIGDADRLLAEYGFGRAHHRVLHFVARRPGLTVADLLVTLKITKQSLNRVLKELVDQGFITQEPGRADRRNRHLSASSKGQALALGLAHVQTARIMGALGRDERLRVEAARFLRGMTDAPRPKDVARGFAATLVE